MNHSSRTNHKIVILGGGTAGMITANQLWRAGERDIAVVEPSAQHYYQPLWTLVGAGVTSAESTARPMADFFPKGISWIQDAAAEVDPEANKVTTSNGTEICYDFLVVATGAQLNWNGIPGLTEAIRSEHVSSNYDYSLAPKTWNLIRNFKGGTVLFHMPGTPIKCPGAPQKIMYLAADHFRRKGLSSATKIIYGSALQAIYGVREYAAVLENVVRNYGIEARFQHELVEILPDKREAVFQVKSGEAKERANIQYDFLHVVPPHRAPEFLRRSALADAANSAGWVTVDKHTMQHVKFANVFALGDVANTPNAKTGAAASHQAFVVVENLLAAIAAKELSARYDGYIACPIVTGYGRMLHCELDYTGKPSPRIPAINTFRERYDMWLLKTYGLPWLYWNVLLPGRKLPFAHARQHVQTLAGAPSAATSAGASKPS